MRPIRVSLSATGVSPWVPLNRLAVAFGVALAGYPSSGASVTWGVQHTLDAFDNDQRRPISIARAGTVATVTDTAHKLSVGDSIFVEGSGSTNLDGNYSIASIVDANTYTYTVVNTGATSASNTQTWVKSLRVLNHATLVGQTGRADGNYAYPPTACRLTATIVSGSVDLDIVQGLGGV